MSETHRKIMKGDRIKELSKSSRVGNDDLREPEGKGRDCKKEGRLMSGPAGGFRAQLILCFDSCQVKWAVTMFELVLRVRAVARSTKY